MQSRRDAGITALVLGFFAPAWFGWGQAAPPAGLGTWLTVGSLLALAAAAIGAVVGFRSPASTAALHDRAAGGVLVTIVALVALVVGLADTVTPSTVTGVGAGLLLLSFAIAELAGALRSTA
jgi:hypothetical protein